MLPLFKINPENVHRPSPNGLACILSKIMDLHIYHTILWVMALMGLGVFVALYFVDAGYGKFRSSKWGYSIGNRQGWFLMEVPALVAVVLALLWTDHTPNWLQILFLSLYSLHYAYRSLVFPFLLKGNSRMPLSIIGMGATFNLVNGGLLSASILYFPLEAYASPMEYVTGWNFWPGLAVFFLGMYTHMRADHTIRHLRRPGDTNHYLPTGGLFDYVTSANYLGELLEWTGFAILLANPAAWMFVWWTAANLVPRAHAINCKYREEFGNEAVGRRKRIIPYIY